MSTSSSGRHDTTLRSLRWSPLLQSKRRERPIVLGGAAHAVRRVRAPGVRFEDLPAISLVLLSHNHYDHCDLRILQLLDQRFHPLVVTPLGNGQLLQSAGIVRVEEIDWWETTSAAPLPITLTPARQRSPAAGRIGQPPQAALNAPSKIATQAWP